MKRFFYYLVCLTLLIAFTQQLSFAKDRMLWVTRWDFKTPADVIRIMKNCAYLGCSHVLFQVRGNATVFYPSKIEPWAWELTGDTPQTMGKNPGWDPLKKALEEAGKHKMELHAWANVMPGWRGIIPAPKGSTHPWVKHRSWFMVDHRGTLMRPSKTFYTFFSPGHPQVRAYCASVFGELARNYPALDGVHLDYIRYPGHKELKGFRDFSHDAPSVAAFKKQYGKKPRWTMPEWQQFKCTQVTETIRTIAEAIQLESPAMELSATCFANIESATSEKGQDPSVWLSEGLVDWVVPMAYQKNGRDLANSLNELDRYFDPQWHDQLIIGLNVDTIFNKTAEVRRQVPTVLEKNYGGEVLFAYAALFPNHLPNSRAKAVQILWKEDRVKELFTDHPPLLTQ